jgi:hypothetical protein
LYIKRRIDDDMGNNEELPPEETEDAYTLHDVKEQANLLFGYNSTPMHFLRKEIQDKGRLAVIKADKDTVLRYLGAIMVNNAHGWEDSIIYGE